MRISKPPTVSLLSAGPLLSSTVTAPTAGRFTIEAADRERLVGWACQSATQRVVVRSSAVLLADAGWTNTRVARHLGISRRTVALWKARYRSGGASSLLVDAPGRGRKPGRNRSIVSKILAATQELPPPAARWTVRSLARALGVSHATVQRVWREHGISTAPATPSLPPNARGGRS